MKHLRLFLALFTLLIGGANASAQTTLTGVSEIISGQEYYIVNDNTGLFLTPGNNWGTRATLDESSAGTAKVTLTGGKYTIIFTWPQGGTGMFVDTDDGSAVYCDRNNQGNYYWTITSNGDNTFNIQLASDQARYKAESYLTAESNNAQANVQYNNGNENLRKWRFISPSEIKTTMLNSEETLDVTLFVHGAQGTTNIGATYNSFDRFKSRYSWTTTGNGWKGQNNQTLAGFTNYWMEAWTGSPLRELSASKTVSDMPEGHYKVSAYTIGGEGVEWFAQEGSSEKVTKSTAGSPPALTSVELNLTSTSNITLGIQSNNTTNVGWIAFDNIKLEYSNFKKYYTDKLAEANELIATLNGIIPTSALNVLQNIINDNTGATSDYLTIAELLVSAMNDANALIEPYSRYIFIRDAVLNINSDIDVSAANAQADNATNIDDLEIAITTVRQALVNYLSTAPVNRTYDLTDALIDNAAPGNSAKTDYWNNTGNVGFGNNLYEFYGQSEVSTEQTIKTPLPVGNYKLTAVAYTRTGYEAKLYANDNSTNIATVSSNEVNGLASGDTWINNGNGVTDLVFFLNEETANLKIGLKTAPQGDHWMAWRSFRLIYGDVFEPYELVSGKMNAEVSAAQTAAETSYQQTPTPTTYQALMEAIEAAQASVNAYAHAKAELDKMVEELAGTNVYTAESYQTYITNNLTAYNDGTLTDAEANAIIMLTDWHTANTIDDVLISAWEPNAEDWSTYHVNNWSTEGDNDGSNFKRPFIEYWVVESDVLQPKTLTATLEGIEPGNYKVTATVRVRITNGATGATGITLQVGDGSTIDVTNGEQIGSSQFYLKEATAYGKVDDDGKLFIKFDVAANNNISWLAFKNVNYEVVNLDFSALNAAIDEANSINSDMEVAALTVAIATAQYAYEATTQDDVNAAVETLIAATNAAKTVIAARKNLAGVAKKATALKSFLDEDITGNITAATEYANNNEATAEEANAMADALNAYFADWEVVQINNGTFDTGLNGELIAPGTTNKPYVHAVDGWTQNFKFTSTASQGIAAAYGSAAQDGTNGTAAPATDMYGKSEGGALHLSSGWSDQARYYQDIENLPAGKYVFYYEGINANNVSAALNSNYFGIGNLIEGDLENSNNTFKYSDEKSFPYNEWKATAFDFTLINNVENARVHVGIVGGTGGSANTPKMWFDNVTIYCLYKTETITIKDGFTGTTYSSDNTLDFSSTEGITAYIITDVENNQCSSKQVDMVPSMTGLYIEGTPGKYFVKIHNASVEPIEDNNLLIGTGAEKSEYLTSTNNITYYLYGKQNEKESFFKVSEDPDKHVQASAHKAYLAIPTGATNAKALVIVRPNDDMVSEDGGFVDGINNIEQNGNNAMIYNLNGQRVNNAQKGIYIKNGKKVIIK